MRCVSLLLVDMRGGGVDENIVCGAQYQIGSRHSCSPGHNHHVRSIILVSRYSIDTCVEQWIIRLKRNHNHAVATLVDQSETVIEELSEEGHKSAEGSREALVRRGIRDEELVDTGKARPDVRAAFCRCGIHCCRVRRRLVHNQVADCARGGIHHGRGAVVAAHLAIREHPVGY